MSFAIFGSLIYNTVDFRSATSAIGSYSWLAVRRYGSARQVHIVKTLLPIPPYQLKGSMTTKITASTYSM